ncbi:MAG: XamI family restriction endonuclease [Egibacteraceae bacterium]
MRQVTEAALAADPELWQYLRYVCGPPISEEDLWTMIGSSKLKRMRPEFAADTAEIVSLVIDSVRFPWVEDGRDPSPTELEAAVLATTCLLAHERLRTHRRMTASVGQEAAAAAVLEAAGFRHVESRDAVWLVDDMDRGTYSRERKVAGAKCDLPVRLCDGRLLLLECKVSNGPKNGWKRLLRETAGKRDKWRNRFGDQAVTGAVVAGVFDLSCLHGAQADRVCLFWQHDLRPLHVVVSSATWPVRGWTDG